MLGADEHLGGAWIAAGAMVTVAVIGVYGQRRSQARQTEQTREQRLNGIYHRMLMDIRKENEQLRRRLHELETGEESA